VKRFGERFKGVRERGSKGERESLLQIFFSFFFSTTFCQNTSKWWHEGWWSCMRLKK